MITIHDGSRATSVTLLRILLTIRALMLLLPPVVVMRRRIISIVISMMNLRQFPLFLRLLLSGGSSFGGDAHPFQLLAGQKARGKGWRGVTHRRLFLLLLLLLCRIDYHGADRAK